MEIIIKMALFAVVGILFAVQFRSKTPEYAVYIGVALGVLFFAFSMEQVKTMIDQVSVLRSYLGSGQGFVGVLMKVTGITYLCEFCAGICKDAGYGAVADQIEILGKLSVIFAGFPILISLIELLESFI